MNIFITGASGGIGKILVKALLHHGANLTCLTRKRTSEANGGIFWHVGDILDTQTYSHLLSSSDAIIHMAALTHSIFPKQYFNVNVEGTRCLIESAKVSGFSGRFIYMSTRAIGEGCGEYGSSKFIAETLLRESGLSWTILRPAEIYGCDKGEAVEKLIQMVLSGPIVLIPGSGNHKLAPVHVSDIVGFVLSSLIDCRAVSKSYVLAGPREYTFTELIAELESILNITRPKVHIPMSFIMAVARIAKCLGLANPPVVPDQIPRLLCHKSSDITLAIDDFGYSPISLAKAYLLR